MRTIVWCASYADETGARHGIRNVNGKTQDERIGRLLDYWFEGDPAECDDPQGLMRKWFMGTPELDRELEDNFGSLARAAASGELDTWKTTPAGRLALIILLDQLPRSLHRGTPEAFASDPKALSITLEGLDQGHDTSSSAFSSACRYSTRNRARFNRARSRSSRLWLTR